MAFRKPYMKYKNPFGSTEYRLGDFNEGTSKPLGQ